MRFIFFVCIYVICLVPVSAKKISFTVDFGQFAGTDNKTRVEMYYGYPDTTVEYSVQNNEYIGRLKVHARIEYVDGTIADDNTWLLENRSRKPILTHEVNLYGQRVYFLEPGQYKVSLTITDPLDTTTKAYRSIPLLVRRFGKPYIEISDLQLSNGISLIDKNAPNAPYAKHNLNVLPNPLQEVVGTEPVVHCYSEIYNAQKYTGDTVAAFSYKIFDGARRIVAAKDYTRLITGDTMIETVSLGVKGLPSGVYYLQFSLQSYKNENDIAYSTKKVYVLNPAMPPRMAAPYTDDELFAMSEWATMGDEMIKNEYEKAVYIATKVETELFHELMDTKAKQKFMYRFWSTRDPDKETPENERLVQYRRAIRYANINYSNPRIKEGWRTDMGRVLCKYGFPTTIDRGNVVAESKAYQTWYFDRTQGGVTFNFVDTQNINNYILVHSTAINEMRNEKWMDEYVNKRNNTEQENSQNNNRR